MNGDQQDSGSFLRQRQWRSGVRRWQQMVGLVDDHPMRPSFLCAQLLQSRKDGVKEIGTIRVSKFAEADHHRSFGPGHYVDGLGEQSIRLWAADHHYPFEILIIAFGLDQYPAVRAFVESIRGTLAGDLKVLRRFYRVELEGSLSDWRLHLLPSDPQMAELVQKVVIGGAGGQVRRIEILEASGDRSVMTITKDGA